MADSDNQELEDRAKELLDAGRLDEAILCTRRLTMLAAGESSAWWLHALALRAKDDQAAAWLALGKVTQLSPWFVAGWCELGHVHRALDQTDDARAAFEQALTLNPVHTESAHGLIAVLDRSERPADHARQLELMRSLHDRDELTPPERFSMGRLLLRAKDARAAAQVYEALARERPSAALFFNLGLCYRALGRKADACDAFETAAEEGLSEDNDLIRNRRELASELDALRGRVIVNAEPALGPKDWYQVYVNPFILLDAAPAEVVEVKALQLARKRVLLEVEVGEGNLEWLPRFTTDKSSVLARLAVLEDPTARKAHERVYEDAALCAFLSRGHLAHFVREGAAELVSLEPRETLAALGPAFAAQFNRVFTRAVEAQDMADIECLRYGRRWVLPEHVDQCFEGGKRALEKLVDPLDRLSKQATKRLVAKQEIEGELNKNSVLDLVRLLPSEFHETHGAIGRALRELSVSLYNQSTDVRQALAILKLAEPCAAKSPALAQQLAEDEKTLNELLVRERSKEAHVTVAGQIFSITRTKITYGAATLAPENVSGIAFGQVIVSHGPAMVRHSLRFDARSGAQILVAWTTVDSKEQDALYEQLVAAIFEFVMPAVIAHLEERLKAGSRLRIGDTWVTQDGVWFEVKTLFSSRQQRVDWSRVETNLQNGVLSVYDRLNPEVKAGLPLASTLNAFALKIMIKQKKEKTA